MHKTCTFEKVLHSAAKIGSGAPSLVNYPRMCLCMMSALAGSLQNLSIETAKSEPIPLNPSVEPCTPLLVFPLFNVGDT